MKILLIYWLQYRITFRNNHQSHCTGLSGANRIILMRQLTPPLPAPTDWPYRRLRSLPEGPTVSLRRHCPRMPNLPAYLYLIRPRMCRPGLNVGILGHQLRFRLPWLGDWGLSHVSRD